MGGGISQTQFEGAKKALSKDQAATLLAKHIPVSVLQAAIKRANAHRPKRAMTKEVVDLKEGLCTFKGYIKSCKTEACCDMSSVPLYAYPVCVAPLDVPYFPQNAKGMCGPTSIAMVMKFWGEDRFNPYDIATAILHYQPNNKRVVKCEILKDQAPSCAPSALDWSKYPGTGTNVMRDFMRHTGAATENARCEALPKSPDDATKVRLIMFSHLKSHVAQGIPVMIHQRWRENSKKGHYRIVTGYDEKQKITYLMDGRAHGTRGKIKQSYDTFMSLWTHPDHWLSCNSMTFNVMRKKPFVAKGLPADSAKFWPPPPTKPAGKDAYL